MEQTTLSLHFMTILRFSFIFIPLFICYQAIRGFEVDILTPTDPSTASPLQPNHLIFHPILTAETHNFPTGVAPFSGAETGTGGRLRDVQATGRGAHTLAGICGYCVGNLHISDYEMPWEAEKPMELYSNTLATPCEIAIQASNGASDYGFTDLFFPCVTLLRK